VGTRAAVATDSGARKRWPRVGAPSGETKDGGRAEDEGAEVCDSDESPPTPSDPQRWAHLVVRVRVRVTYRTCSGSGSWPSCACTAGAGA